MDAREGQASAAPLSEVSGSASTALKASEAEVVTFLEKLGRISDSARDFSMGITEAVRSFRIPQAVLDYLTARGLPHRDNGSEKAFDPSDLRSVMLHLGCGSVGLSMRRFWPTALNYKHTSSSIRYEIRFESDCVTPADADPCQVRFYTPDGYVRANERTATGAARLVLVAETFSDWPDLEKPQRDLIDTVACLDFMWLPGKLRGDEEVIQRTGLGDCVGVARMLARTAARRGVVARTAYGLIIAPPFCAAHYWTEFLVCEQWVPVDPLLIKAMVIWGALPSPEWNIYRSPGVAVYRLGPDRVPLTKHTCGASGLSCPVRRIAG